MIVWFYHQQNRDMLLTLNVQTIYRCLVPMIFNTWLLWISLLLDTLSGIVQNNHPVSEEC